LQFNNILAVPTKEVLSKLIQKIFNITSFLRYKGKSKYTVFKDGRLTVDELNRYFLLDEQFEEARHRIRSAQTLVIDEIGMLSELILEKVELVCRLARNSKLVFGGLQVIEIISSKKKSRYKAISFEIV
jgi:hypothetical protein